MSNSKEFTNCLSLAWTGDFNSLKKFVNEVLRLDGVWSQSRNDRKVFSYGDQTILWRRNKLLLSLTGDKSNEIGKQICELLFVECPNVSDLQSQSCTTAPVAVDEIENLKLAQQINNEAIQSLAESILKISSEISILQEGKIRENCALGLFKEKQTNVAEQTKLIERNISCVTEYVNQVQVSEATQTIVPEQSTAFDQLELAYTSANYDTELDAEVLSSPLSTEKITSVTPVDDLSDVNQKNDISTQTDLSAQLKINKKMRNYLVDSFHGGKQKIDISTQIDSSTVFPPSGKQPRYCEYGSPFYKSTYNHNQKSQPFERINNTSRNNFYHNNFDSEHLQSFKPRHFFAKKFRRDWRWRSNTKKRYYPQVIKSRANQKRIDNSSLYRLELPTETQPWDAFFQSVNRTLDQYGTMV